MYFKKTVTILVVICFVFLPMLLNSQQSGDYETGRVDGRETAKGSPLWILGGFLCGIFAVAYVLLQKPSPSAVLLVGKSQDYVLGFTQGYKKKIKSKNLIYSLVGWGVWVVVLFTIDPFDSL